MRRTSPSRPSSTRARRCRRCGTVGSSLPRASVQARRVGLAVVALKLLDGVVRPFQLLGDAGPGGDGVGVPRLRLPQLTAQERLAAVEEHLLDMDLERELRAVALDD